MANGIPAVLTNELVQHHIALAIQDRLNEDKVNYEAHIGHELTKEPECESPLEAVLVTWLAMSLYSLHGQSNGFGLDVRRQVEIEANGRSYRADFLIGWRTLSRADKLPIVVEVDGHAFHEKTREQVERRNERDRDLQLAGYPVMHFSFTEVVKRPKDVVSEIWFAVRMRFDDEWRKQMESMVER